jgi:cell wall-associated NlpC family hydrolase
LPYQWGGDDPIAGFDCSGLVIEILKSVGRLPRQGDWTADGLYRRFNNFGCLQKGGALAFWKNDRGRMIHVEFCIDENLTIGASGGGSRVKSVNDAIEKNAYVKVRPTNYLGLAGFVDPFADHQPKSTVA